MNKKLLSNELLIGISAMIISLSTLIVFIYQTNLIRKQQYKSVYPHLNFVHMHSHSTDYHFALRNQGIGPAFIQSISITDSTGKSYPSLVNYLKNTTDKKDSILLNYTDIDVGNLIQEKQVIELIKLSNKSAELKTVARANMLRDKLLSDQLQLSIVYTSIYDEQWTINNKVNIPLKH